MKEIDQHHFEACYRLWRALVDSAVSREKFYEVFTAPFTAWGVIYAQENRPVGLVLTVLLPTALYILYVGVLPEYRRRGLASAAIEKIVSGLPGSHPVIACVPKENWPARYLFVGCGFLPISQEHSGFSRHIHFIYRDCRDTCYAVAQRALEIAN